MQLSHSDILAAKGLIIESQVLLLQLEVPIITVMQAARIAHENHVTVILNPPPAVQLPPELLKLTDILVPNQSEAAILSGESLTNRDDDHAEVLGLKQLGVKKIILTLGSRGALLIDEEESVFVPAFSVTPVDTTACGDAFLGAFAVALAESKPLLEAVRWGNAAGALASTRIGAQTSLPTKDEIEQLLIKYQLSRMYLIDCLADVLKCKKFCTKSISIL